MTSYVKPDEIIIVDNGSTDGTFEFCQQYAKDYSCITVLQEPTPGAAAARNKGLAACRTEWVYFFDSDDTFDSRFLQDISALRTDGYDMIAVPTKMSINGVERVREYIPSGNPDIQLLANVLNTQAMVFRTSFLKDIGAWNEQCMIWNDWELGLRALLHQANIFWFKDRAFHIIYVHPDSITGPSFTSNYKKILDTLRVAIGDIQASPLNPISSLHAKHPECFYPQSQRLMVSLYYRIGILLGKVINENRQRIANEGAEAIEAIKAFRNEHFQPTMAQRMFCNFLTFYTQHGGRGAWRIAMKKSPSPALPHREGE